MKTLSLRLFVLAGLALFAQTAQAQLSCPQPVVQVGVQRAGAPLRQCYTLVNVGSQAVDIEKLHPSCGCMTPRLERRRLEPGEHAEVVFEVHTLTQGAGPHTWRLEVCYRMGQEERVLDLYLTAPVMQELSVQPPSLTLFPDVAAEAALTLTERRPEPLTITTVQAPAGVRVRTEEPRRDRNGHWTRTLHVEVLPEHPAGRHEEPLHLRTTDPIYADLAVPVTVIKHSAHEVRATPSSVELAAYEGQPVPSRIVLLGTQDEQAVQIERVETSDPAIHCTWLPGPGSRATLRVRVERSSIVGDRLRGLVQIHLRSPHEQTLELPITCSVH